MKPKYDHDDILVNVHDLSEWVMTNWEFRVDGHALRDETYTLRCMFHGNGDPCHQNKSLTCSAQEAQANFMVKTTKYAVGAEMTHRQTGETWVVDKVPKGYFSKNYSLTNMDSPGTQYVGDEKEVDQTFRPVTKVVTGAKAKVFVNSKQIGEFDVSWSPSNVFPKTTSPGELDERLGPKSGEVEMTAIKGPCEHRWLRKDSVPKKTHWCSRCDERR